MAAAQVKAGDVLAGGKYRVERVLGVGGMGMVVAARHVQLGQRVALKFMLKEAMTDPSNAERFAREARAAVQLQSPHTARVLDVGTLNNGEPYMVMEYLDGHDLDEVSRQVGPMAPHTAVGYMLQACEAFAEAHGLGMIHRDIKLKNLFLTKSVDGRPLVKVLDFGLAKTAGGALDVSLTSTTAVFGSPQYMSPEQMRSAKDVDARSDVWSIGVCLYELLTAHVPFDAPGVAEICAMVLKDPVVAPSRWAPGLPAELDAVVVRCLAKDPGERYQTVAELAYALEPWTALEGSASRILHVFESARKNDLPTLMDPAKTEPIEGDGIAKTMDAWGTGGERARASRGRLSAMAAVTAASAVVLALLVVGGVVFVRSRAPAAPATQLADTPATAEPVPVADPAAAATLEGDPPPPVAPPPPSPPPVVALATTKAAAKPAPSTQVVRPSPPPPARPPSAPPLAAPKPTSGG
ncbi:MAG TPA: serine/threonine-protein kinase, partial [Labilithrix sp.]|nr:serine/threonine-protein kinase [Labilithrix sp.]